MILGWTGLRDDMETGVAFCSISFLSRQSLRPTPHSHGRESTLGICPRQHSLPVARENENDVQQPIVGFRGGRDRQSGARPA
jgi:hypothetical protein